MVHYSAMLQESTYLATLTKLSPLFDGIGADNLSALFACLGARRVRLAKGEPLLRTGEKADRIVTPCENACAFHARLVKNIKRTQ